MVEGGQSRLVWQSGGNEGDNSCCNQPPCSKRLKMGGKEGAMLEEVLVLREAEVMRPLQQSSVEPGSQACLVAWVTLPVELESRMTGLRMLACRIVCPQARGVVSGSLVLRRSGSVRGGRSESVEVVGRVELPWRLLTDPALRCGYECLYQWTGQRSMSGGGGGGGGGKRWDFSLRETQDLACFLATHHLTHVHPHPHTHTHTHTGLYIRCCLYRCGYTPSILISVI